MKPSHVIAHEYCNPGSVDTDARWQIRTLTPCPTALRPSMLVPCASAQQLVRRGGANAP
jgi:hypothetical protein